MGLNAVLPPSTGWGFQFHTSPEQINSAQHQKSTSQSQHSSASSAASTALHFSNLFVSKPAPKRKLSDSMDSFSDSNDEAQSDDDDDDDEPSSSKSHTSRHGDAMSRRSTVSLKKQLANNTQTHPHFGKTLQASKLGKASKYTPDSLAFSPSLQRASSPSLTQHTASKVTKRPRFDRMVGRPLPISRLVETLDKKALEKLVTSLVNTRPDVGPLVLSLAPIISVATALEVLKRKLEAIYLGIPYKGDQHGDYAYLRVRPGIDDFLATLSDYTAHFLPPNEPQPSNSLAFLDSATMLLHKLPTWTTQANNHARTVAYDRISSAWILALQEASKRANGLGIAYGGWQHKLDQHNEMCGNLLVSAVNFLRQALRWVSDQQQQMNNNNHFYYDGSSSDPNHNGFNNNSGFYGNNNTDGNGNGSTSSNGSALFDSASPVQYGTLNKVHKYRDFQRRKTAYSIAERFLKRGHSLEHALECMTADMRSIGVSVLNYGGKGRVNEMIRKYEL